MNDRPKLGPGRTPPPAEHRFLKGTSGNKRGRPKGAVSLKKLTHKVARKKHRVVVAGRVVRKTLLQLVIEAVIRGRCEWGPFDGGLAKGNSCKGSAAGRRKTGRALSRS